MYNPVNMAFLMDVSKELSIKNPAYLKSVKRYVWEAYLDDLGEGDITTELFVSKKAQIVRAEVTAKEAGVLAGVEEALWFLKQLRVRVNSSRKEGATLKKGDVIMKLEGRADRILAVERTLLNLLQRMSGVATSTSKLVSKLPESIRLLATRKTLWGDLDKRAVSVGGGYTHRLNLADAVLLKENHISLIRDSGFGIWDSAKKGLRFVEVELENLEQVKAFADSIKKSDKVVVMLDNFKPEQIKKAVQMLKKTDVLIEVSGGVNEKNIKSFAVKGVDAVSSGSITNKAPSLDFSLTIFPDGRKS